MRSYTKTILRDVGLMLHIPGGMALVSIWVGVAFQEFYAIAAFLLTSLVSFGIGQLLYRSVQQYSDPSGFVTSVFSPLLVGEGLGERSSSTTNMIAI